MAIKGWSEARQLPRLGMIRLGIKKKNANGVEFPTATDYFVCPPEVQEKYGDKPRSLDIRLPLEGTVDDVFPQFYKLYGRSAGLKAVSDGERITWLDRDAEGKIIERIERVDDVKKLEEAGFRPTGTLSFLVPKVSMAGVYQLVTGSFHTIRNINSGLDLIRGIFGRVAGLPLKLVMIPQDFNLVKDGKPFKKTAYVVQLRFDNAEIMEFVQKRKKFLTSMQEGNNYQVSLPKAVEVVEEPVEDVVNNENARTEIDTAEDAPLDEEQAELL